MKAIATIQSPTFFTSTFPATGTWGESRQRTVRRAPRVSPRFALDTDDLAATKQETVCTGILALCFLYTLGQIVAQFAF